tara:strand:+ start:1750 stop:2139 length:390 start_codon:yes stop_codon:yes gene_type:complete
MFPLKPGLKIPIPGTYHLTLRPGMIAMLKKTNTMLTGKESPLRILESNLKPFKAQLLICQLLQADPDCIFLALVFDLERISGTISDNTAGFEGFLNLSGLFVYNVAGIVLKQGHAYAVKWYRQRAILFH